MAHAHFEPWLREEFVLQGVPAMISRAEQKYLFWLARTQWRDEGHVVEIGPWLGGSTLCLAAGMRAGGRPGTHKLHAFDNFVWRDFMTRFAPLPLNPGESFERFFLENVSAHGERIESHTSTLPDESIPGDEQAASVRGTEAPDLPLFSWDAREPIEILFVDGAKSWRGMRWMLSRVAESLIPTRTLLVCQDFKYWGAYWVPLMIDRLRSSLELVHDVERGSTATFRLRAPLTRAFFEEMDDNALRLDLAASFAAIERMAAWIEGEGDPVGAAHVDLGGAQLLAHHGRLQEALAHFERLQASWPLRGAKGQLEDARRTLAARGLTPSPYRAWRRVLGILGGSQGR